MIDGYREITLNVKKAPAGKLEVVLSSADGAYIAFKIDDARDLSTMLFATLSVMANLGEPPKPPPPQPPPNPLIST